PSSLFPYTTLFRSIDLLGHAHRAELGGDPGPRAPRDHERGDDRAELPNHRRADQAAEIDVCAETLELDRALEREDHAGEQAREQDDRDRAHADPVHLDDDIVPVERACDDEARRSLPQGEILLDAQGDVSHPDVHGEEESSHPAPGALREQTLYKAFARPYFAVPNGSGAPGDTSFVHSSGHFRWIDSRRNDSTRSWTACATYGSWSWAISCWTCICGVRRRGSRRRRRSRSYT